MLEKIFGNKTAVRVLLHLYHYGELHASAIAKDYKVASDPIRKQLDRFELAGILVSKEVGRARVYLFNHKSPFVRPIRELLNIAYHAIPLEERERVFKIRRRPRRKGKPIL